MIAYAQQLTNGEMPEIDADADYEEQKAFYQRKFDIIFLESEWEVWHIHVWNNSLESSMGGVQVNPVVVFEYAIDNDMNKIELFSLIKTIERGVVREQRT